MSGRINIGADNQYILYYSKYCINCKEFLNILVKNTALYQKFEKVDVQKSRRPVFLKVVPTIIVPNIPRPLEGSNVFRWLEQQSQRKNNEEKKSIVPYLASEMGGIDGGYSYLGVDDRSQPMEQNFTFIDRGFQKINTPAEDSFATTKPKKLRDLNSNNRQAFPQVNQGKQMQAPTNSLPPPMSSSSDDKDVEDAYNNLLTRRQTENQPVRKE